ncbi:type II secretion system protein [Candidatus Gottesmanbacteria bacterium]|nr:type II secretion system protein [Candidatus Gottesmanbacteria bacterium]
MLNKKSWGFTLLELLVSISIIGVLISLASVSYSTAQKKARDAKRQGDLKTIQNALEQYYSICGYNYPATMPGAGNPITCALPPATTVLDAYPIDPKTGVAYPCTGCSVSGYTITATGEILTILPIKNLQ